jgi:hypothetical protein
VPCQCLRCGTHNTCLPFMLEDCAWSWTCLLIFYSQRHAMLRVDVHLSGKVMVLLRQHEAMSYHPTYPTCLVINQTVATSYPQRLRCCPTALQWSTRSPWPHCRCNHMWPLSTRFGLTIHLTPSASSALRASRCGITLLSTLLNIHARRRCQH